MPYSYGKESGRQVIRIPAQRRVVRPSSTVPQRGVRRQKSRLPRMQFQMILGICLVVFSIVAFLYRIVLSTQFPVQFFSFSQNAQTNQDISIPLSFPVTRISQEVTAFRQADKNQYNSENPEWSQWSYSACSGCAMAALMDSYGATLNGKPLNCGDVLETEYRLSVYNPVNQWGLINGSQEELVKTAAQFGFTGYYKQKLSLDDLITLANAGVPSIVRIPTHIMILTGGDSQNVFLADSGGLHLSKVTRTQFLHGLPGSRLYAGESWMNGWYVILTQNNKGT